MSYIIEQKIKGRIYLYSVESYWDKKKKQPRQKRVYLGPKEKRLNKASIQKTTFGSIISQNYGNILLFNKIVSETGLESILKEIFSDDWKEILGLSYYEIMEGQASYSFRIGLRSNIYRK